MDLTEVQKLIRTISYVLDGDVTNNLNGIFEISHFPYITDFDEELRVNYKEHFCVDISHFELIKLDNWIESILIDMHLFFQCKKLYAPERISEFRKTLENNLGNNFHDV